MGPRIGYGRFSGTRLQIPKASFFTTSITLPGTKLPFAMSAHIRTRCHLARRHASGDLVATAEPNRADCISRRHRPINGHSHSLTTPRASMHQQDGPLDATERIFGTTAE